MMMCPIQQMKGLQEEFDKHVGWWVFEKSFWHKISVLVFLLVPCASIRGLQAQKLFHDAISLLVQMLTLSLFLCDPK